MRDMS